MISYKGDEVVAIVGLPADLESLEAALRKIKDEEPLKILNVSIKRAGREPSLRMVQAKDLEIR